MHSLYLFTILKKNCHSHFKTRTKLASICLVTNPWKPNCVKYSIFYMHLLKNYCLDFNSEKTYKLPIALSTFDLNLVSRPNLKIFYGVLKLMYIFAYFHGYFCFQKYFCDLTLKYVIYFRYLHDLLFKIEI